MKNKFAKILALTGSFVLINSAEAAYREVYKMECANLAELDKNPKVETVSSSYIERSMHLPSNKNYYSFNFGFKEVDEFGMYIEDIFVEDKTGKRLDNNNGTTVLSYWDTSDLTRHTYLNWWDPTGFSLSWEIPDSRKIIKDRFRELVNAIGNKTWERLPILYYIVTPIDPEKGTTPEFKTPAFTPDFSVPPVPVEKDPNAIQSTKQEDANFVKDTPILVKITHYSDHKLKWAFFPLSRQLKIFSLDGKIAQHLLCLEASKNAVRSFGLEFVSPRTLNNSVNAHQEGERYDFQFNKIEDPIIPNELTRKWY